MERAGRGVVEAIFEEWPELKATSHRAVVLCGPGNNGGDGFVVARLLKEWGWEVEVFLYGDPERLPPDARVNYERWLGMGEVGSVEDYQTLLDLKHIAATGPLPNNEPLIVDAIFGIGSVRSANGQLAEILWEIGYIGRHEQARVVSIDIPSGLCADSGRGVEVAASAALTVTFHRPKIGQRLGEGPVHCGKLRVCDIGLASFRVTGWKSGKEEILERLRDKGDLANADWRIPKHSVRLTSGSYRPWKWSQEHKYSHGHALILSGPSGRGGAARLAARGALRIGAGVVTVGCPPDAIPEHAARLDAVMLRGVADGLALEERLADQRINALCLGPGLGLEARGREVVAVALGVPAGSPPPPSPPHEGEGGRVGPGAAQDDQSLPLPRVGRGEGRGARRVVLDADALTILSQNPDLFAALHEGCVLTPHAGEFARLFPDIAEKLAAPAAKGPAYSKVDATREAAARAGCVVLYKGPDTVIADPSGRCAINSAHYDRAAPWLATAGSGDVLAGFITGLLARGFSPFDAACTGAWLHVECALSFGPGLIAEDLPEELPKVFRALGL